VLSCLATVDAPSLDLEFGSDTLYTYTLLPFFSFLFYKSVFPPSRRPCLLYLLHAVELEEALARSAAPDVLHDDMPLNNAGLAKNVRIL
jgi:hypothetical protein